MRSSTRDLRSGAELCLFDTEIGECTSLQYVSWLTSLLHADILSSRFDQQANSPGSWTKLALKPLLLKRIQNASLETCSLISWEISEIQCFLKASSRVYFALTLVVTSIFIVQYPPIYSTLLDVPPRASCHQDGPSLDELRERPGGETQDKTCRAGARAAVRGSCRWASWDPLAVALQHKDLQQNHKFLN
ncbi:Serine/threonine-protein kinase Nek1 [Frankliniella fusca]|uniref:Serine/threonine-protein kinase Nek1 n=1 Tax=Frankliniella fusca TaxID=407009 RepID=A0AAE1LBR0_9NEOP|nr:Serine/threonine-protein kinase Nek1 [Frankliniella fusca]